MDDADLTATVMLIFVALALVMGLCMGIVLF